MNTYRYSIFSPSDQLDPEEIAYLVEQFSDAGCIDGSLREGENELELIFVRTADSLEEAIAAGVAAVEGIGGRVLRTEVDR